VRAILMLVALLASLELSGIDLTVLSVFGGRWASDWAGAAAHCQQLRERVHPAARPQSSHRRPDSVAGSLEKYYGTVTLITRTLMVTHECSELSQRMHGSGAPASAVAICDRSVILLERAGDRNQVADAKTASSSRMNPLT